MMRGISECCRYCTDRYEACHDYCEKYQEALEQWHDFQKKVKEVKEDPYKLYLYESCMKTRERKARRRKNGQRDY